MGCLGFKELLSEWTGSIRVLGVEAQNASPVSKAEPPTYTHTDIFSNRPTALAPKRTKGQVFTIGHVGRPTASPSARHSARK